MNYEERQALFNAIIENEFKNISTHEEYDDNKENDEMNGYKKKASEITEKLFLNISDESGILLNDLEAAETDYWTCVARYYFKKGVSAGLTNLNFLNTVANGTKFY